MLTQLFGQQDMDKAILKGHCENEFSVAIQLKWPLNGSFWLNPVQFITRILGCTTLLIRRGK